VVKLPFVDRKAETVGPYALLEKLGEGGMGAVYKACHQDTGELVAVKLLFPEKMRNAVVVKRFEQEFLAARRLDHPHVVRVLEFGKAAGTHYLVMELVQGPSLGQRLVRSRRLPEKEAVEIILQVAAGLQQIHEAGLVHRDVKPDNVLLAPGQVAKLSDLGLVKILVDGIDLTRPNSGLGTPNYMAPEQFSDARHADQRCDVYSLGATLYTVVTGEVPFRAANPVGVFKKKQACDLTAARALVPGLSEAVERTINRALNLDPRNRHASCREFAADLTGKKRSTRSVPVVRPAAAWPAGNERRSHKRFPTRLEGYCQALSSYKEDRWTTRVVDVSRKSAGLIVNRRFEPGTVLVVYPQKKEYAPFVVRVERMEARQSRTWLLGCQFARLLTEDEVQQLVAAGA
jgi:serine/threonine protein kinase